jgi:penicillin-insensitive murein endopeptidase
MPLLLALLFQLGSGRQTPAESLSFGGGACGKLQGGAPLPCSGNNFQAFAETACSLGRNYLHPLVRETVLDAFKALESNRSKRRWQYGEMGKERGGPLWPHKTHQNGLAADFFMPVVNASGAPAQIPISPLNKFGYGLEFDKEGKLQDLIIDWRALGEHLLALESAGGAYGVQIERIIITPDFHEKLFRVNQGLKRLAPLFLKKEAWVRHDEHYHVDFRIPERLRRPLECEK